MGLLFGDSGIAWTKRHGYLLSPAITTLVFVGMQLVFGAPPSGRPDGLAAAATKAVKEADAAVRVSAEISSIDQVVRKRWKLPRSEEELLSLFEREGAVVFDSTEVDVVGTPSRDFRDEEGGRIVLRKAKLKRASESGARGL